MAIQHARIKLREHLADEYPTQADQPPRTWKQFVRWMRYTFQPPKWDIQSRLHVVQWNVHTRSPHLRQYVNEFQASIRDWKPPLDDAMKKTLFLKGMTPYPYFQYAVLHGWREVHTKI